MLVWVDGAPFSFIRCCFPHPCQSSGVSQRGRRGTSGKYILKEGDKNKNERGTIRWEIHFKCQTIDNLGKPFGMSNNNI